MSRGSVLDSVDLDEYYVNGLDDGPTCTAPELFAGADDLRFGRM
jgi:hypothetical protein